MDDNYNNFMEYVHKFHEDILKGYLERPNKKLDESIRNLSDEEFFLLSMLVFSDYFMSQTENKYRDATSTESKCVCDYIDTISKPTGITFNEIVNNAPTVELDSSRPQHGEWIDGEEETGALGIVYKNKKCSQCGWESSLLIPRNFCPNCGADMKGGEE